MKLRSQLFLILFLFGLTPILAEQILNLPLIYKRMEDFYRTTHLRNLRADFWDLDQHLASRQETVRILSRLPEFDELLKEGNNRQQNGTKKRYTKWMNHLLSGRLDLVQIVFLDSEGHERFWLERDPVSLELVPVTRLKNKPHKSFIDAGLKLPPGGVLNGPIRIDEEAGRVNPTRFMNLQMVSPIYLGELDYKNVQTKKPVGSVVVYIDVGVLPQAFENTYWVHDNGNFLHKAGEPEFKKSAFEQFPELNKLFSTRQLGLWKSKSGKQIIWIPLLQTEKSGPIWVGRNVDSSEIENFRETLISRLAIILAVLTVMVFIAARYFARRTDQFRVELTSGIQTMLTEDEAVEFNWQGPAEIKLLSKNLTRLAKQYRDTSNELREHANQLELSNQYKSEFLANVSHELRTPLNSILLLSKLLSDNKSSLGEEQKQQASVINKAGTDLSRLINDILDLSKIEAGKTILHSEQVDLALVFDDLQELFQPQINEKGLNLHLSIDDNACTTIISDGEKIRQILKNFLSNAIKFTASGDVQLKLVRSSFDKLPVQIEVIDNGIGIAAKHHELIFHAFQQADGSTSRRYGGTGLGLSISRELASLMGGRIHVQSEEGRGATFSLILPVRIEESETTVLVHDNKSIETINCTPPEIPSADYNEKQILVVDDDLRNLVSITPLLEKWNLEVFAAGDGKEALDTLLSERNVQLILMDIMMPEMDGYDALGEIRTHPEYKKLPVIALTAKTSEKDVEKWQSLGGNEYLQKPLDPAELKSLLDKYLVV